MDSHLYITCQTNDFEIDQEKVCKIAETLLSNLGLSDYELGIQFVDPERIHELNAQYRGKDKSTDVLSFPLQEWPKPICSGSNIPQQTEAPDQSNMLGDIVISLPDAEVNAHSIGHDLDRETAFLIVHGILHLCGHDHMEVEEERRMLTEQDKLMGALANSEPPLWISSVHRKEQTDA